MALVLRRFQFTTSRYKFCRDCRLFANATSVAVPPNEISNVDNKIDNKVFRSYLGLGFKSKLCTDRTMRRIKNQSETDSTEVPLAIRHLMSHGQKGAVEAAFPGLPECIEQANVAENLKLQNNRSDFIDETQLQYPFQQFYDHSKLPTSTAQPMLELVSNEASDVAQKQSDELHAYIDDMEQQFPDYLRHELSSIRQDLDERSGYGKADIHVPPSKVPCGGCGAFLHCNNPSIPGFIPVELFANATKQDLRKRPCQRCLFLQHHNAALNVRVSTKHYSSLIYKIAHKPCLVIVMVDLTDMPCSLWPQLSTLLGSKKTVLLVGNKADLLPRAGDGYFEKIRRSIKKSAADVGLRNVKDVCLISAKTGFGVEELITKIHDNWRFRGDIFLLGCTNVGKSSLFNAFLGSDLCKSDASDLIQRATASPWPGTTLNLLKFPLKRFAAWELRMRAARLSSYRADRDREIALKNAKYGETLNAQYATLIGRIDVTFSKRESLAETLTGNRVDKSTFLGPFCYDTPGAVYEGQILDLLTIDELNKMIPSSTIVPRTFVLHENRTLFLAGLGRVDLLKGPSSGYVLVTVFGSSELPIHIVKTENAEPFYAYHLGTEMLGVPFGKQKRLKDFPPLESETFELRGEGYRKLCADIILSSAGWVSFAFNMEQKCRVRAFTPSKRGLFVRCPALIPDAILLKGERIPGSPAYQNQRCL